jgi:hypothetical protein
MVATSYVVSARKPLSAPVADEKAEPTPGNCQCPLKRRHATLFLNRLLED